MTDDTDKPAQAVVYQHPNRKWGWRVRAAGNYKIIATDGNQQYENEADARAMLDRIVGGEFKNAKKIRVPHKEDR
jgi:hypothetical protein